MHLGDKLFNNDFDWEVLTTVEFFPGISVVNEQAPFGDLDKFVSQIAELDMWVRFSEFVDCFFGEHSLDEIVSIWN